MFRFFFLCVFLSLPALAASPWEPLAPGVELGEFDAPLKSTVGDSRVTVLRVEVKQRPVRLLNAAHESFSAPQPADAWAKQRGLVAVINAGMFHPNGDPVGLARTEGHVLTGSRRKQYQSFLVLNPVDPKLPAAQLLDAECDDVEALLPRYRTVLQSIRMVDCKGRSRWSAQPRMWSAAVLGIDTEGRLLFIHARSPYRMKEFSELLLKLPLGLARLMYLEGGPEATLHIATPGRTVRRVGSYETGFNENDDNREYWALPNVLGVTAPEPPKSR